MLLPCTCAVESQVSLLKHIGLALYRLYLFPTRPTYPPQKIHIYICVYIFNKHKQYTPPKSTEPRELCIYAIIAKKRRNSTGDLIASYIARLARVFVLATASTTRTIIFSQPKNIHAYEYLIYNYM